MLAAVGQPVPDTAHAVSVSLPTWKATVGYEEGEDWVLSKMRTGYPRFFIHLIIQDLQTEILHIHGTPNENVMLFPSPATAQRCQRFLTDKTGSLSADDVRLVHLRPRVSSKHRELVVSGLSCVFFPKGQFALAKQVWQHSGDGISSRRAEFCLNLLRRGLLHPINVPAKSKRDDAAYSRGPRRYQRGASQNGIVHEVNGTDDSASTAESETPPEGKEYSQFVEERFGRNLNATLAAQAKLAIRRRIAGSLVDDVELDQALSHDSDSDTRRVQGLSEESVYLYPTGMSAIFNTHRTLLKSQPESRKSICFGFPYIDTLKILQKWGPGCLFYGNGNEEDLDDLEGRLRNGEQYLALFTEFPSNPLLRSPDLARIRSLADRYDFSVVVDETVGNFININVLSQADVVVSSLTKVFSGDSNVMGGSCVLNPHSHSHSWLKQSFDSEYEDNYWAEDAVFMERNSRDFVSRIVRVNANAEALAATLHNSPLVKQVYYPQLSSSKGNYDACRCAGGGYGGLLSVTLKEVEQAVRFFDALEVQKGPSLGTNFTLSCPYTILAHYGELDWAASFGVDADLVRISVGLEETEELVAVLKKALAVAGAL